MSKAEDKQLKSPAGLMTIALEINQPVQGSEMRGGGGWVPKERKVEQTGKNAIKSNSRRQATS